MRFKNIFLISILFINQFSLGMNPDVAQLAKEETSTATFSPIYSVSASELESVMRDEKVARIVSFDGGGIRGIIPAVWANYIEEQTHHPMSELFHLMAGTSTGGILAGGLLMKAPSSPTCPLYTARNLTELYINEGAEIFQRRSYNPFGLFGAKYLSDPIYNVLTRYFHDVKLSQIQGDLLIPYYNMSNNSHQFFKSHFARNPAKATTQDYYVRDVMRATTAAPTYFEPFELKTAHNIDNQTGESVKAIDGGVFANDPAGCALTEAAELYPHASAYMILSLGTGFYSETVNPWGLLSWASVIPGILMGNASAMVRHTLKEQGGLYSKKVYYCRLQLDIPEAHAAMDNTAGDNLEYLRNAAETYTPAISQLSQLIPALCVPKTARALLTEQPDEEIPTNFMEIKPL